MQRLFQPIICLKTVSKKRAGLYAHMKITTPYDLLWHLPRTYQDYRTPVPVAEAVLNQQAIVKVRILAKQSPIQTRNGMTLFRLDAEDETGTEMGIVIFNQQFLFQKLQTGKCYTLSGRITMSNYEERRVMQSPKMLQDTAVLLEAVYPQTAGLTSVMIRTNMKECLELLERSAFETIPEQIRYRYQLVSLEKAFHDIHQPETLEQVREAKHRLAFEEQLRLETGLHLLRMRSQAATECRMKSVVLQPFLTALPFTLTQAQIGAIREIIRDMSGERPMHRLLQGDVGSGKTVVAAAACYFCAKNQFQSVLMAPTEILAEQHFRTLCDFLGKSGINVVLLTGSLTAKQKKARHAAIADGSAQVIVGTHAVFQKAVTYRQLGLVITDEQHRFGVEQRESLAGKGHAPHRLVMSATPIPRTLALAIYGDLDISVLDAMPQGRLPVKTYAVTGKLRSRAMQFLIEQLRQGRQAYIVCPAITGKQETHTGDADSANPEKIPDKISDKISDKNPDKIPDKNPDKIPDKIPDKNPESELKAVTDYLALCRTTYLSEWRVGMLHGQMSAQEKDSVMQQFRNHELDVLICTTVVEVGVDVPNATVMMIEDAERFGLSQLHQLRGRVGRCAVQSYCILLTEHPTPESRERLRLLSNMTDGFAIAEADLQLRKAGDFIGNRQHGLPSLQLADLLDNQMLAEVQEAREQIISQDERLEAAENEALLLTIQQLFSKEDMENSI